MGLKIDFEKQAVAVLENMVGPFLVLDKRGDFLFVNREAAFLLKREREDLLGKHVWDEFKEAVGTVFYHKYQFVVQTGTAVKYEAYYEPLGAWFEVHAVPFTEGVSIFFSNINDRKIAEERRERHFVQQKEVIAASEKYFREMADNAPVMIWTTDTSGYCTYINKQWLDFTGQQEGEVLGLGWIRAIHPEDSEMAGKAFMDASSRQLPIRVEYRLRRYDGVYRYTLDNGLPRYNEQGEFMGFIGTVIDITERKVSETLLRESEERLRLAIQSTDMGTWDYYPHNGELIWSDKCKEVFGVPPESEVDYDLFLHLLHPDDRQRIEKEVQRLMNQSSGGNYDVNYRVLGLEDKKERWVSAKGKAYYNEEGKAYRLIGTLLDITENQQAAEKFRFLADAIPQMVWTTEPNGDVDYWNAYWYTYTDLSYEDTKAWGWQKVIHPEDLDRTLKIWRESLRDGHLYEVEYRLLRGEDHAYRWHLGRALPMKDPWGRVVKWFGTCTDIHDQKLSEENLLKANQELSKINADLDNFIYTASHDLKSPIVNMEGLLQVLQRKIEPSTEVKKIMEMMETSIHRFKNTIQDLTEISKLQKSYEGEVERVDVAALWEEVLAVLQPDIEQYGAKLLLHMEVTHIHFYRKNLRSILYNLLSNAVKYSSPRRRPLVQVKIYRHGSEMVLSVADNGMGFAMEQKNKIFGMFKRLHTHVEGSGIGLYIIKRMVENAGGHIEVESRPDEGAVFRVFLPQEPLGSQAAAG